MESNEAVDYEAADRAAVKKAKSEITELDVKFLGEGTLNEPVVLDGTPSKQDSFSKALVESVSTQSLGSALRRKAYRKRASSDPDTKSIADEDSGYSLLEVAIPKYNLDKLADLYERGSSANAAAIKAKTSNVVGLGHEFVIEPSLRFEIDQKKDAERKKALIDTQKKKFEVEAWLDKVSKDIPFSEVLNRVWTDYEATGNGYLEIGRQTNGQIGYIGHIPAVTMRVRKIRDGFVQISGDKAQFFRNFGDKTTRDPVGNERNPNEIIHLKKYSPSSGYYGVPDIVTALTAVAGNNFAETYNLEYFENKAVPRYLILSKGPQLSFTAQQRISEFFSTDLKGQNHRSVYIPLPADTADIKNQFEIKPIEATVQDSSFTNYMNLNLSIILMAHRTPHSKVMTAGDANTLAAAKDFDKTFKEQVCRPEQALLNFAINRIVKEYTDVFLFKLNELSLTDEDTQSQIDDRAIKNDTLLPNEVRARKGLSDIVDGDKTFTQKQQATAAAGKTDPTSQQRAEDKAQATGSRARDQRRVDGATDSKGQARSPKGDGRSVQ